MWAAAREFLSYPSSTAHRLTQIKVEFESPKRVIFDRDDASTWSRHVGCAPENGHCLRDEIAEIPLKISDRARRSFFLETAQSHEGGRTIFLCPACSSRICIGTHENAVHCPVPVILPTSDIRLHRQYRSLRAMSRREQVQQGAHPSSLDHLVGERD